MKIEQANLSDLDEVSKIDREVSVDMLERKIRNGEVLLLRNEKKIIAYLRYSFFWDELPFVNLLIVDSKERKKGFGSEIMRFWEERMNQKGYDYLMTSSQSDESGQHFFRKLGYEESGRFDFPDQAEEIIFSKGKKEKKPNQAAHTTPAIAPR